MHDPGPTTVITPMVMAVGQPQVWQSLLFYEQIDRPPPLLLRLLLPRPLGTEGSKAAVGDQSTCLYESGHLLKRVTEIDPMRLYAFSVVEQQLTLGRGIVLNGGAYSLRTLQDAGTELRVTTHYSSRTRPRWLMQPIEIFVCHMFHRFLLRSIRAKARLLQVTVAPVHSPRRGRA